MRGNPRVRLTLVAALLLLAGAVHAAAQGERGASGFGAVAVPQPAKPAAAEQCVEPVEVMRRDHMKFLMHQRDATVIDGERDGKYALVDCMNCHNPGDTAPVLRYEDPGHFCADCHVYAGISIDCFECHADRGLQRLQQGRLQVPAWADRAGPPLASALRGAKHAD